MLVLNWISKSIDRFNTLVGYLCGLFAFLMVAVVFAVVVLRYGFSIGFIWMQEVYVWPYINFLHPNKTDTKSIPQYNHSENNRNHQESK